MSLATGTKLGPYEIVAPDAGGIQYGLAPDGKRLVLVKNHRSGDVRSEYRVALNWFDEVRARAPRSK